MAGRLIEEIEQKRIALKDLAGKKQTTASSPQICAWVGASAGTGKTKVLTDRVLRLLLSGVLPNKILCLTFTKAAAAEMANRITAKLSHWAMEEEEDLIKEIEELTKQPSSKDLIKTARKLFAVYLDAAGGMQIRTIHSFCQSLLERFPLEAEIMPNFEVISEQDSEIMLNNAKREVFLQTGIDKELTKAFEFITENVHETNFDELIKGLINKRGKLHKLLLKFGSKEGVLENIKQKLNVKKENLQELEAEFIKNTPKEEIKGIIEPLMQGSTKDKEKAEKIGAFLGSADKKQTLKIYIRAFLTDKNTVYSTLATSKTKTSYPLIENIIQKEANRVLDYITNSQNTTDFIAAKSLITIGSAFIKSYDILKIRNKQMDYEDLIILTEKLLSKPNIAPWILYKLDFGIEHILVDEAQDNSQAQWHIIKEILSEFFSGESANQKNRTIFAVGDKKQSIFSFQGADPASFDKTFKDLSIQIPLSGKTFEKVDMATSFRSSSAVLRAVNEIFSLKNAAARKGLALESEDITHYSAREGEGGLVEVWPSIEALENGQINGFKPMIERIAADKAEITCAKQVADKIKSLIKNKEILESKNRPIKAGDIMILLQKRWQGFIETLISELKEAKIEVCGIDRMILTDQLVTQDLMALGQFLLLPEDDLNFACLLKSPLFCISEEELFELCYNRKGNLWQNVKNNKKYEKISVKLKELLSKADFIRPFELYSEVLSLGGYKEFLRRLGAEASDALDEFMSLCLSYEQTHIPTLQGFLYWLKNTKIELKREQEHKNAVRIMTVHGSKGLQSSIVFLADTKYKSIKTDNILEDEEGLLFWSPKADFSSEYYKKQKERAKSLKEEEQNRLLYVALTRAQDRLYITGWDNKTTAKENNWYDLISKGLQDIAQKEEKSGILRIFEKQQIAIKKEEQEELNIEIKTVPNWIDKPAAKEIPPFKPLAPSRIEDEDIIANSPLKADENYKYIKGRIIHKILEILPLVSKEKREENLKKYIQNQAKELSKTEQEKILKQILKIINKEEFANFFGSNSSGEVAVSGIIGNKIISGKIDRLIVLPDKVIIIDFKSNKQIPQSIEEIPKSYLKQLAAYKASIEDIFKDKKVECGLLWTDTGEFMPISNEILDVYIKQI